MRRDELQALQAPLKQRYRSDPEAALVTLCAVGALGERPTHPELLDDLAVRFMDAGWSLKWLQRQIVLSAAYRQRRRRGRRLLG